MEKTTKRKMEKMIPPTVDQAIEGQQKAVIEKISQIVDENNLDSYRNVADELLEQKDASTIVAAVLKMLTKEPDTTPVQLTEEKPLPSKRDRRPYDKNNDRGGRKNYNPRQRQGYGSNKRQGQSSNSYNKSKSYR